MNIDIDKAYAINTLIRIYERFRDNAEIRETEHGYHIRIPLECTQENFIYCLVIRREFDDRNRIAMFSLSNFGIIPKSFVNPY